MIRRLPFALLWLVVVVLARRAGAEPLDPAHVPPPLAPWTDWVLADTGDARCPTFQGSPELIRCVWPSRLALDLDEKGGRFEQRFHLDTTTWVPLPGDDTQYPQDVRSTGKKLVVVPHDGRPSVRLPPGDHTVSGTFAWDSLPDSLALPQETGLVSLSLSGVRVPEPRRDDGGRVFLQKAARAEEGDRLEVLVHRKITDEVPVRVDTRILLNVAGKSREVVLGKSLFPGFVPMSIESALPARIEPDTRLRVQVRPGTWTITVGARSEGPVAELVRPAPDGPWREGEEVWVFDARPSLRLVSVEGVHAVDPQQTSLPDEWKSLPAYSLGEGETMRLVEKRRGDAEPEPDQLSLTRSLWLDFDGGGFTANDGITGTFHRATRLEMNEPTVLGRVAIDGKDQFITRGAGRAGKAGVEIRQGNVRITADSRIGGDARDIPAVGYDHDFHEVSETLHLPPGYRLLHVAGADEVPGTWIRHWTLLEIFLVLVLSLAFGKLFGVGWGAIAGLTFVLVFPESDSPEWIWAAVLVMVALTRVIPEGKVRSGFVGGQLAVLVALVLVMLPFIVQHVREGIYPALAEGDGTELLTMNAEPAAPPAPVMGGGADVVARAQMPAMKAEAAAEVAAALDEPATGDDKRKDDGSLGSLGNVSRAKTAPSGAAPAYRQWNAEVYDPNAMVQTGPGLPKWNWSTTSIRFSGPVERTQRLHLYLLPPPANLALALVRAALLLLVFVRLLPRGLGNFRAGPGLAAGATLVLLTLGVAPPARADIPSNDVLEELKKRLLEKPDCIPTCAAASRMLLEAQGNSLRARLEISANATTAVPLPGGASQWVPERVLVDGAEATGLLRTTDGQLWLRLAEGSHDVVVEGSLPSRDSIQLALPLKPHYVEARVDGFTLEGLHEDGLADDHLQLTRKHVENEAPGQGGLSASALPPFVRVERTLHIGLNWQVETHVKRVTPEGTAVVLEVPLLPGESVTTAGVRVAGGKALVNMAPEASEATWTSVLREQSPVKLVAPKTTAWAEVWRLDLSPIWHATLSGIAVVHGEAGGTIPEWRPWPGEATTIELVRPAGVPGQTLTIDSSEYTVRPGLRATDATVTFTLRSSRGAEHTVRLPAGADLESITVNGAPQPLRKQGNAVTLSVTPGTENVVVGFRLPEGMTTSYRVPAFDFGTKTVNSTTIVNVSDSRWVLFVRGPRLGPAVLFWSLLLVLGVVSYGLGAIRWVPLARHEWMLLAVGLSQVPLPLSLVVVLYLVALGYRKERPEASPVWFDLRQLALVAWTAVALGILVYAVHQGLMGEPDMQIRGNGSYSGVLRWFDDRTTGIPEQPLVISVPMLAYRGAMLAWALWLAVAVLRWLRFGWQAFSTGGLWKKRVRRVQLPAILATEPAAPAAPAAPSATNDEPKSE
ncbi:MAG TPA: hypothetical protein VHE30_17945 [Polyangiaceae bacterium]|nr:hypothetical protein [Polyangiaceae bacterium]